MPIDIPLPISKGGTGGTGISGVLTSLGLNDVVYTTGDQTISGKKTFSDDLTSLSSFEVGSSEISPTVYVKGKRVSINRGADPQFNLDVSGSCSFTERPVVNGSGVFLSGDFLRGQLSKINGESISITGSVGLYQPTNLSGVFDTSVSFGTSISETGFFGIKNTSNVSKVFKVYASMDATAASNETLGIKIAKNNETIEGSECRANTSNQNFAKLVTSWMIRMNPGDEISLFVANHSSTNSINFQRGRIIASSVE
jgi:hypothetical protein